MSNFPNSADSLPTNITPNTPEVGVHATLHNNTSDAVNAIETALLPGGTINTTIAGKAPTVHTHAETDVTNLGTDLAAKAAATGATLAHPAISDFVEYTDQAADATAPAAGKHRVFSKAGGVYVRDSAGVVVGPVGISGTAKFRYGPGFPSPVAGDVAPEALADAATTSVSFQAKRTGGTGATVDLQKNGVSILTAPLSLTATTWMTATLVAAPNLATGDTLQAIVTSVTGGVTLISTSYLGTQ